MEYEYIIYIYTEGRYLMRQHTRYQSMKESARVNVGGSLEEEGADMEI